MNSQLASECWLLSPLTEHSEASWEFSRLSGPSKSVAKCCKFLFLNYKCIKVFPKKFLSIQNIYKCSYQKKATRVLGAKNPPWNNPPSESHFGQIRIFSQNWDMKKSWQWGDCHWILEFDIFVRYDSMNLSDYRRFSRFWRICGLNSIWVDIMAL